MCIVHVVSRVSSEAKGGGGREGREEEIGRKRELAIVCAGSSAALLRGQPGQTAGHINCIAYFRGRLGAQQNTAKSTPNRRLPLPLTARPMCWPIINELNLTFGSLHAPTTTTITTICIELRGKKVEVEMLWKRFEVEKGAG